MNHDHTRDLEWWQVPRWAPTTPRILASMLAGGFLGGLVGAILYWLTYAAIVVFYILQGRNPQDIWMTLGAAFVVGLKFGVGIGLSIGFGAGRSGHEPKRIRTLRAINFRSVLSVGLAYGLVAVVTMWLIAEWSFGLTLIHPYYIVVGIVLGLPLAFHRDPMGGLGEGQNRIQEPVKKRRNDLVLALAVAIGAGVAITPESGVVGRGVAVLVVVAIMAWYVIWRVPQLMGRFVTGLTEDECSPHGPLESWRNDRVFGLVAGLAFGLAAGLVSVLVLGSKLAFALSFGPVIGLTAGLTYGIVSSATWPTTLAWRLQLQRSGSVPAVSLMPFLEDARERGVLRTVGAVYQFRHATLQDYLASHITVNIQP